MDNDLYDLYVKDKLVLKSVDLDTIINYLSEMPVSLDDYRITKIK